MCVCVSYVMEFWCSVCVCVLCGCVLSGCGCGCVEGVGVTGACVDVGRVVGGGMGGGRGTWAVM